MMNMRIREKRLLESVKNQNVFSSAENIAGTVRVMDIEVGNRNALQSVLTDRVQRGNSRIV